MKKRNFIKKEAPMLPMYNEEPIVEIDWRDYTITIPIAQLPIYEEDRQASHWYVKCHSCNQYFSWSHPEHWYTMCEDCVW